MLQDNILNLMIYIQDNPAAFAATLPRVLTYCYLPANAINTLLFPNNLRLIVMMMMLMKMTMPATILIQHLSVPQQPQLYDVGDDEDYIGNGHHGSFPLQLRLAARQPAAASLNLRLEEPCNHRRHPPRHHFLLIFNYLCPLWHCYDHNICHHHYPHRHLPTPQKCRHQKVFFLLKSQQCPFCYLSR